MTETSKKRKRSSSEKTNQTVAGRSIIDANWQKFLASNLINDKKMEKIPNKDDSERFTGTFRRVRKKKSKKGEASITVQNDMKSLNISIVEPKTDTCKDTLVNGNDKTGAGLHDNNNSTQKRDKLTKFIAIDCEMVGTGFEGADHMLARISLVNKFGDCIYDKFVKPREQVTDYRTSVSGVRREDLLNGEEFSQVQKDVAEIIRGRVLVGHSLKNDLSVLFLSHPKRSIRDTSRYKPFRNITKGSTPSLKRLAKEILGIDIQHGEHSSVEDARAAMQLYCTVAKKWELGLAEKRGYRRHRDD